MEELRSGAPTWVVDPLDGTRPFAHGQPGWGVLVAFCAGGVPVASWMHDPLRAHARAAGGGACDALDHGEYPLDGTGHTSLIARTPLLARQLKQAVACAAR
ncbi:inositol monophosphatase family protein [Rhodovibrio sodomensis]|uniref:inositol monophosphatase family protein n=1 Tax=Rhodovibrio sodomensis TaxID=1088 RepID=UPI001A9151E5